MKEVTSIIDAQSSEDERNATQQVMPWKTKAGFIKILKHFTSGDKINEDDLKIFSPCVGDADDFFMQWKQQEKNVVWIDEQHGNKFWK